MKNSMAPLDWAAVLTVGAMFASSFFFQKIALTGIPPFTVASGRLLVAFPVALLFLHKSGGRLPPLGSEWKPLIVLGIFGVTLPFAAVSWGLQHIESALGGILMSPVPLFTVTLAYWILPEERLTPFRLTGVAAGFGGVVLIIGPSALEGLGSHLLGELAVLVAPLCYSVTNIYVRRHPGLSPSLLAAGQFLVGACLLIPLSLIVDTPWRLSPSLASIASVGAVGIFATGVPNMLVYWLIGRVGSTNTSMIAYFIPVFALGFGAVVLGEWLPWENLAGLGLILFGALLLGGGRKIRRDANPKNEGTPEQ